MKLFEKLNQEFGYKFENNSEIDWHALLTRTDIVLSDEIIDEYAKDIDWAWLCILWKLSEEWMEKRVKYLNWNYTSACQVLSEEFIERHKDKVNWHLISSNQNLSEDFINSHSDLVDWFYINLKRSKADPIITKLQVLKTVIPDEPVGRKDMENWILALLRLCEESKMRSDVESYVNNYGNRENS